MYEYEVALFPAI